MQMDWIKIKDAAKLTKLAERTLRHQAVLGRLRCKKDGRDWLIDRNSLRERGLLPTETENTNPDTPPRLEPTSPVGASSGVEKSSSEKKSSRKKNLTSNEKPNKSYLDVTKLGVYNELLNLSKSVEDCQELPDEPKHKILNVTEQALIFLAQGFFEFKYFSKLECYAGALRELARLTVQLHLVLQKRKEEDRAELTALTDRSPLIIAGVKGLIRKTEARLNEKRTRTQTAAQS